MWRKNEQGRNTQKRAGEKYAIDEEKMTLYKYIVIVVRKFRTGEKHAKTRQCGHLSYITFAIELTT